MYSERVAPYAYELPCGRIFRTYTPSVPDDEGNHFLPCTRCGDHVVTLQTVLPASRRDMEMAKRIDKALIKDRIVATLRRRWDEETYAIIANRFGVSEKTVWDIATSVGVADYYERGDRVHGTG